MTNSSLSQLSETANITMSNNPVAIGDQLRDHVINLLEARGVRVEREIRIGIKRVDVLATLEDDLEPRRIAIECKNFDRNLSQQEVAVVYTEYESLLNTGSVDGIWLIARKGFSPDAKHLANAKIGFKLFTIDQFEERQFGFSRYVRQLIEIFREQDLNSYYIQQRVSNDEGLIERVHKWIEDGEGGKPLAILGGYGMGKTSFCKYLIYELGTAYLNDVTKRVPIYVRLSEIAKEQELEGLLGKMLAARYRLSAYHFHDIMKLNRRGKFVFIFDGFDEMKHALSWDLFKFNFGEINRAVVENSRVVVAGRPNAFLSDQEHSWALRGTRISGEQTIRLPGSPEYIELTIQPFSKIEAQQFLRRYLTQHLTKSGENIDGISKEWVESRVREFESITHQDDFKRPVHLKIFADIATNRDVGLKDFSVYELYEIATKLTIDREMQKTERLPIDGEKRSKFLQDVAWWLWEKDGGRSLSFNPREVPTTILRRIISAEHESSDDGLLREMFSGAFIERKFGDNFYFAHRSFLEFFIAKKFENAEKSGLTLGTIDATINIEIVDFLRSGEHFSRFVEFALDQMRRYTGELKLMLLNVMHDFMTSTGYDKGQLMNQQHIDLLFKSLPLYDVTNEASVLATLRTLVESDLPMRASEGGMHERGINALYFIVDAIIFNLNKIEFREVTFDTIRELMSQVSFAHLRKVKRAGGELRSAVRRANFSEFLIINCCRATAHNGPDGTPQLLVDFGRILNEIYETRRPKIVVANRTFPLDVGRFAIELPFMEFSMTPADWSLLIEGLR
ncbi:NACHT domain-containing protein [Nitrobacter winogradskyi]|uniref:Uncharacterized protein n=1 Tax=Nitrobacter winogradskyi TaxID=913 RepID=A0ACC6AH48_NITWI|nr:NACHT domain-containing protein [Nitrobacter winogradskyi]MCP1999006.1 hypothetical protein [Nitrobacter winogradskyi]